MKTESCELLTVDQAAAALGLRPATVRAWVLRRKIEFRKIGTRAVRISADEVARIRDAQVVPARGVRNGS